MDQEKPRNTLRVVRALLFDPDGLMLRIRRGPEAKLAANLLSLLGGKVDDGESDEAAIRRELAEETSLTDEDILLCSQLATIIGNANTSEEVLVETVLFAVFINKSSREVALMTEGNTEKEDHDLQAIDATSSEFRSPDEWAFGYGYLLQIILSNLGEFPQEIGIVDIDEANVLTIRATLNRVGKAD